MVVFKSVELSDHDILSNYHVWIPQYDVIITHKLNRNFYSFGEFTSAHLMEHFLAVTFLYSSTNIVLKNTNFVVYIFQASIII